MDWKMMGAVYGMLICGMLVVWSVVYVIWSAFTGLILNLLTSVGL